MDFHGLLYKFPVGGALSAWEAERRLYQGRAEQVERLWGDPFVIKMNSTYLETVDKFFDYKGFISAVGLTLVGIVAFFVGFATFDIINDWADIEDKRGAIALLAFALPVSTGLIIWLGNSLRHELFRYTHYPMRFNRKNRMVYVTRLDGTVMAEPWDRLVFAQGQCGDETMRDIRGHRMTEDGVTVLESFALPDMGATPKDPHFFSVWEFVRRYMEHGPAELMDKMTTPVLADIGYQRERLTDAPLRFKSLFEAVMGPAWIIALPLVLWYSLGRWIAMHTCKIPVWPDDVEAECPIDPDDPYLIDRDHLPEETDFSWWTERER